MLKRTIKHVHPSAIRVDRDNRQRREIDTSDLIPSVKRLGILNPIIVKDDMTLVAGERRLATAIELDLKEVPIRFAEELSPTELQLIELDENMRRKDLPWQDQVQAMARLRGIYQELNNDSSLQGFCDFIGYTTAWVSRCLDAAEQIAQGNERVLASPTMSKAINVITRQNERIQNNALADILDTVTQDDKTEQPPIEAAPPEAILNQDFHSWATTYDGPKFNLLHCDFPYGIDLQDSDQVQAGGNNRALYEDSETVYWDLLNTLADNQDRILSSSCHLVFWFSMEFYQETLAFFEKRLPTFTLEKFPLIWWKTDNKGIAPDVERRPRRVYETALFGWRGDRKLVKLFSNAYGAPKANSHHVSEKPEPVLRHFLGGICDLNSRVLDPTCGSGSALRAAESLGASKVLGLEIDPDFCEDARAKLKQFRSLRRLTGDAA